VSDCNVEEILKELKVLDSLKQLRENMADPGFMGRFPELSGIDPKLDAEIKAQEERLETKMDECGHLNVDELPEGTLTDITTEPELDSVESLPL
jgi:hypothetical protein